MLLCLPSTVVFSQFSTQTTTVVERQNLSFREILTMITLAQGDLVLRNCTIRSDSLLADPVREAEWRENLLKASNRDGRIFVDSKLQLDSCKIAPMKITGFHFEKGISFNGCVIDEYLGFQKCVITSLGISKTTITTKVEVEGLVNFELDRCTVGGCVFASNDINSVNYERTHFTGQNFSQVFAPFSQPLNQFSLTKCTVDSAATFQVGGYIRSCILSEDTTYGALNISPVVLNLMTIERCAFNGAILYDAFNTPERATTLRWEQFSGYKITVRDTVTGKNVEELDDYEMLLKTYSFFYNIYGKNWQDESKNDCYVEMKTVQTRWLGISYKRNPTFTNWMVWQLNIFLETFCKYGTEPVMAIQYSLWILFFFAALYFIFPSQPEAVNGVRFTHTFYDLATHKEERIRQVLRIGKEMDALRNSHNKAPVLVRLIGTPFYYGHIVTYQLRLWNIRQSEFVQILQKRWEEADERKHNKIGIILSASGYFGALLLVAAAIRGINAAALSLNAFVTLGYGEIQARGLARYLAVLEGALGWFLLSIFSVSLISQILQ
ncbi:MAG: hypothetical protein MUF71_15350 [Candidatus Kapabacteria bacterium]|jgi:hypothetical protein|nr:hypothetical protein [Candidatus Kapabacteria bacterium]